MIGIIQKWTLRYNFSPPICFFGRKHAAEFPAKKGTMTNCWLSSYIIKAYKPFESTKTYSMLGTLLDNEILSASGRYIARQANQISNPPFPSSGCRCSLAANLSQNHFELHLWGDPTFTYAPRTSIGAAGCSWFKALVTCSRLCLSQHYRHQTFIDVVFPLIPRRSVLSFLLHLLVVLLPNYKYSQSSPA